MKKPSIAIIGAGISGLTLAHELTGVADVTLFEKSKGVGGRMATRRAGLTYKADRGFDNRAGLDSDYRDVPVFTFDHGTQYFTAKTSEFKAWLQPFLSGGLVAEWRGRVLSLEPGRAVEDRPWPEPHYVAVPQMNSLAKHLAANCTIGYQTQVAPLAERQEDGWLLHSALGEELGRFDWVISTAPTAQTVALFGNYLPQNSPLAQVTMQGCFTLMLGFAKPWDKDWIAVKVRHHPIEWIAVDSSKPGRDRSMTTIVVHSSNAWAQEHLEDDAGETKAYLLEQLSGLELFDPTAAGSIALHRWRYALKTGDGAGEGPTDPYLNASLQLGSTGDWCAASRIEAVWLSARRLAQQVVDLPGARLS